MTPLTPKWTLHDPTAPQHMYTQTQGSYQPLKPFFHQPISRNSHTTMFGFLFIMKKFKELGYQKADGFPGLESP